MRANFSKFTRKRTFYLTIPFILAVIFSSRGTTGGDEGAIYRFAQALAVNNFDLLAFFKQNLNNNYLAHHLFWFFIFSIQTFFLNLLGLLLPVLKNPLVNKLCSSYLGVLICFLSIYLTFCYVFKKTHEKNLSLILTGFFWLGGYGVCFLTGGVIENYLVLAILVRMFIVEQIKSSSKANIIGLLIVDVFLCVIKSYCIFFCLLTVVEILKVNRRNLNNLLKYIVFLLVFFFLWNQLKNSIFPQLGFMKQLMLPSQVLFKTPYLVKNIFEQIFSFTYGLIWTFPPLLLIFFNPWNKVTKRLLPILIMMVFFGFFSFWNGNAGIAGNRYIFPFLFWLLPLAISGAQTIVRKNSLLIYISPLMIILFFPAITYRHNLIIDTSQPTLTYQIFKERPHPSQVKNSALLTFLPPWNSDTPLTDTQVDPLLGIEFNPKFHPAIIAWKSLIAAVLGKPATFEIKNKKVMINPNEIFPMTLLSRLWYLKFPNETLVANMPEVINQITKIPVWVLIILKITLFLLLSYWLIILLYSARKVDVFFRIPHERK